MPSRPNIVLVGFMGTGKTTVGRLLARDLDLEFLDMDSIIEEREGKPIPRIFAENGEPYFRARERDLVRELSARSGLVVGAGGGIVLNPDNIADFGRTGMVVCLWADPEVILRRVASDTNRPLLAGDDKMQKIRTLLESRRRLYEAIPHRVDTSNLAPERVAAEIRALYLARAKEK